MNNFKEFILNENKQFFATQCGDILNAIQNIAEEASYIGERNLVKYSQNIANNIRNLIKSSRISDNDFKDHLRDLQKIATSILKSIEESSGLLDIIKSAKSSLEELVQKLGTPINNIGIPEKESTAKETE
jgi:gas vesicle protein